MAIDCQGFARYAWENKITTLATNTTLGTATRYDTEVQTAKFDSTIASGRFAVANGGRVMLRVVIRDAETATVRDLDGVRLGIKINAVAFDDLDVNIATVNSGDHWHHEAWRDVTAYFAANDPGTVSFSVQAAVAVATSTASLVNNISFELYVTWGRDSASTTIVETAIFPIQSHYAPMPSASTFLEVGTTVGTANAPANQIVQLTGSGGEFENVTGFAVLRRYLQVIAMDNGLATTDFAATYRFDGAGATFVRATLEQALNSSVRYVDNFSIDASGANLSTSAVHAFEVSCGVANRFEHVGALDVVTYEYTASSTQQYVSVCVPLERVNAGDGRVVQDSTDPDRLTATLDVQEPATIDFRQSGVYLVLGAMSGALDTLVQATSQTARTYNHDSTAVRSSTVHAIIHRCDHSSSNWDLARGVNHLSIDAYGSSAPTTTNAAELSGFAILNYRCGKHPGGAYRHNRTYLAAQVISYEENANNVTQTPNEPVIATADYVLQGVWADQLALGPGGIQWSVRAKRLAGEDSAGGWWGSVVTLNANVNELGAHQRIYPVSSWFRKRASLTGFGQGGDIEGERKWHTHNSGAALVIGNQVLLWVSFHAMTFTVASTVTIGGAPAANGKTVQIFARASDGTAELVASPVTTGGTGAFTAQVPDNTRSYFASYDNDGHYGRSALEVPV